MTYRWTILLCALTSLIYLTLAHFNKLPLVGAFGISRWWDVAGLILFVPLTFQMLKAMNSTDPGRDHFGLSLFLGWLAGTVFFFWKGCLAGFIAAPAGFIGALVVYYFLRALSFILEHIVNRFGWWLAGEARSDHKRWG